MNRKLIKLLTLTIAFTLSQASVESMTPRPQSRENTLCGYTPQRFLGYGEFGIVILAIDDGGNQIAIKITSSDPKAERLLRAEFEVLRKLNAPFIVRPSEDKVHTVPPQTYNAVMTKLGQPTTAEVDKYAFVMEYVDGKDLRARLKEGSRYSIATVHFVLGQLLSAVSYMHGLGIMSRDIKAANIIMTEAGCCKLCDFGLAKEASKANEFAGTAYYVSPEIACRGNYSHKTDVWSLGVVLYELLNGQRPFKANAMPSLLQRIREQTVPNFDCTDPELKTLVVAMLTKDPDKRPSSAECLASRTGKKANCLVACHIHHINITDEERVRIIQSLEDATGIRINPDQVFMRLIAELFDGESFNYLATHTKVLITALGFNPDALQATTLEEQFAKLEL